ncbi:MULTISPECIES: lipopolysaccharide heptosyltransferase II [unclassified Neptuniibacter]|uniref:lipopolysaccharide heptosyltransferase II n=1 Tax=unclassified Neptuniibacter TaxID=2630693 RepID=UPI000C6842F6|nr:MULTISPECIES: lipopolysaccharide heptosyltransferase II [unclassified Neptuniibacter]MAY43125.1 lipopolysaccharide heptosyltransferase II [Oceanospirillaceae bacterium]|tara:strand:- start:10244 stop:11269 length:1026 start_codon:yes stop_codon:yes gene_type:complete
MKTLIIGPSWVGDMLMSQSLYRHLKQQNPDIEIDVLAPNWCRPVLARMPEVNQAIEMPVGHGSLQWGLRKQIGKQLSQNRYEQALVLPNSLKSALIPWFASIPKRTGWRGEMRYGLLNDIRPLDKEAFPLMVQRYVALSQEATAPALSLDSILYPQLSVDSAEYNAALIQLGLNADKAIAFCPGAEFGPAKRWPDYHYAALAKKMITEGYQIWLFGSEKDRETCQQIQDQLSEQEQKCCHNLAGTTSLPQAIDLIAHCEAAVSNDSGLMHIAAAVNTPLVALYGPTSPSFTPPLSHQAEIIKLLDGFHKIRKGDAEQGYHQSMIDITPDMAQTALQKWLTA